MTAKICLNNNTESTVGNNFQTLPDLPDMGISTVSQGTHGKLCYSILLLIQLRYIKVMGNQDHTYMPLMEIPKQMKTKKWRDSKSVFTLPSLVLWPCISSISILYPNIFKFKTLKFTLWSCHKNSTNNVKSVQLYTWHTGGI